MDGKRDGEHGILASGAVWTEAGCDGSVAAAALFCFSDGCCKEGLGKRERESYD